jgi:hypothetical protein
LHRINLHQPDKIESVLEIGPVPRLYYLYMPHRKALQLERG